MQTNEMIGWVATAAFAASYLCKSPQALRRIQALAAGLWILYGVLVGALPVIVANTVVATMAVIYPWAKNAWDRRHRDRAARVAAAAPAEPPGSRSGEETVNIGHLTLEPFSLPFAAGPLSQRTVTIDSRLG